MKKVSKRILMPPYDFSNGIRGKYAKRFAEGTNIIVLAADVAKIFPDSNSVNEALRAIAKIALKSKMFFKRNNYLHNVSRQHVKSN